MNQQPHTSESIPEWIRELPSTLMESVKVESTFTMDDKHYIYTFPSQRAAVNFSMHVRRVSKQLERDLGLPQVEEVEGDSYRVRIPKDAVPLQEKIPPSISNRLDPPLSR